MYRLLHHHVLALVLSTGLLGTPSGFAQPEPSGGMQGQAGFEAQVPSSPGESPAEQPAVESAPDAGVPDRGASPEGEPPPQFDQNQGQTRGFSPEEFLDKQPGQDLGAGTSPDVIKPKGDLKPGDLEVQGPKAGKIDVTKPKPDPSKGDLQVEGKAKVPDVGQAPTKPDPDKAPDQKPPDQKGPPDKKGPDQSKGQDPWKDKDQAKGKGKDKHDDYKGKKGGVVIRYHPTSVITYIQGRPVCGWRKVTECSEKKVMRKGKKVTIETCVDRKKPIFCY